MGSDNISGFKFVFGRLFDDFPLLTTFPHSKQIFRLKELVQICIINVL
jgi:hypothetical protein